MKNILTLLLLLVIPFAINSQVSTIIQDSYNVQVSSNYYKLATLKVFLYEKEVKLVIDYNDTEHRYKIDTKVYILSGKPIILYNVDTDNYNILFNIEDNYNKATAGLIDLATNSITFYYIDNSSLLYIGKGIKFNI